MCNIYFKWDALSNIFSSPERRPRRAEDKENKGVVRGDRTRPTQAGPAGDGARAMIASTSSGAPRGRAATWTVLRAGNGSPNHSR